MDGDHIDLIAAYADSVARHSVPVARCLLPFPHKGHEWFSPATQRECACPGRKVHVAVRLAAWRQFRVDLEDLDLELGR